MLTIVVFAGIYLAVSVTRAVPLWVQFIYVGMSVVTFLAYWIDKRAATSRSWRTPESTLLLLGFLGGWPGAILAQLAFRHKTSKQRFRLQFWASVVLNVAVFLLLTFLAF